MSDTIASQFVGHDFSGFIAMTSQQTLEESFRCSTISASLNKHINNFAILIDSSPQVLLLAVYVYEDCINVERITITNVPPFQPSSEQRAELDAGPAPRAQRVLWVPETYRFPTDSDTPLCEQIFNIPVAELKSVVEPDCVENDIQRESMSFVGVHPSILPVLAS
jgi:hypothetical protein